MEVRGGKAGGDHSPYEARNCRGRERREGGGCISLCVGPASLGCHRRGGTGMSNCAVCHRPTTTRCARCKVVKYWLNKLSFRKSCLKVHICFCMPGVLRVPQVCLEKKIANKNRVKQNGDSRYYSKARSFSKSSHPGINQAFRSYDPKLGLHDLFDERLRQSKLDMSSDSSSLFSCSDEGSSWSADSTKDSATTEDFTESINGEPGLIYYNSPDLRFSEAFPPNSNGKISVT